MISPAPSPGPAIGVNQNDRRLDAPLLQQGFRERELLSPTAVPPPDALAEPPKTARELPVKELDARPAEPADLIATLRSTRATDASPDPASASEPSDGPFGPPPAFEQSPLQAERAAFPEVRPENPASAYSALQRLETPFDTATVDISR